MTTHSLLSPSKRNRWAFCPGSVREEAKYPEEPSGMAAVDGTHTHSLLEECLTSGQPAASYIGKMLSDDEGTFIVDKDRAARVQVALDYVDRRVVELGGAEVISETRVDPKWFTGRDDLSGTADIQIIGGGVLEIVDYKDGMNPVEVEDNLQLEQYAIGKLAECRLAVNTPDKYPWHTVMTTIIRPKMALRGMEPIVSWTMPIEDMLARVPVLTRQAQATDDPNAPLVPGDEQCKYCRAKANCPALMGSVMKLFKAPEALGLIQSAADKEPAGLPDSELKEIIEAAPLIRQFIEAVEKEAMQRMQAGRSIDGLKLVNGRGSRAWMFKDDEMADKLIRMGIPKTAIYETKLISPAKAEKLVWVKRDGTKMSLSERQLKRMDQDYVARMSGKLTVVSSSDSRPAVSVDASELFSPIVSSLPSWLS